MDWYSRCVLSWRLSTTLDNAFCVEALKEALERYSCPEIFNSDQGCQFTSDNFTSILLEKNIKISMDGKGRALDLFLSKDFGELSSMKTYTYGGTVPSVNELV
jgi:putative transposase